MPGARYLWPLRAAALLLVLALLFDPPFHWAGAGDAQQRWVLLDASLSMAAASGTGASPWVVATRRARELQAEGWRVVTFGQGLGSADSIPVEPGETATLLAPALVRAAESGAREIRVLSDLRIEDAVAVRAALERLGATVAFEPAGDGALNVGLLRLEVEDRSDPGAEGMALVEMHGGRPGDSIRVEVLEEGTVVASGSVEAPGAGLRRAVEITLPAAGGSGLRRFQARLAGAGDAFPLDDAAVAYARVGSTSEGGVVVISANPDWEPRALLPVLARTTGLAGSGYLRAGPDRWLSIGRAVDRAAPVDSATVRGAAEGAALLVLHGLGEDTEGWVRSLATRAPRLVAFASDPAGAEILGLATSSPRAGEWYLSEEIPSSPLSGVLQPLEGTALPPLGALLVPQQPEGAAEPITVRLRGTGPAEAPIRLRASGARREALVLARGFWRWAARPAGAEAYETLWAGVAGWLLREPAVAGVEVRPARRVVPRGEQVSWLVPAHREGGSVAVRRDGSDDAAERSPGAEVLLTGEGTMYSGALPPGPYRYTVFDVEGDSVAAGRFDVAEGTSDMLPGALDPEGLAASRPGSADAAGRGRPLRTSPWPYLLVLALLCAEWVGRRRSGLR